MLIKDPNAVPDKWGKRPSDRSVGELLRGGVIILDKPSGPTSHQATAWVRDALKAEKVGHGGTLDPYVSGVLPVTLGKATRLTDIVLSSDKEYICLMRLHGDRQDDRIREVFREFVGKIYQLPPVRSSVKRQLRIRTITDLEILEIRGRDVLFRMECDAGTYARSLCVDIGDVLGCGANMVELRRSRSGKMTEARAHTLQDIRDAYVFWQRYGREEWLRSMIMPMEALVEPLPKIVVKATAVDSICHGADLNIQGIHMLDEEIRKNALVAMMTARGELIAIGRMAMSSSKIMATSQGKAVDTERVFMEEGHYPRMWKYSTDLEELSGEPEFLSRGSFHDRALRIRNPSQDPVSPVLDPARLQDFISDMHDSVIDRHVFFREEDTGLWAGDIHRRSVRPCGGRTLPQRISGGIDGQTEPCAVCERQIGRPGRHRRS